MADEISLPSSSRGELEKIIKGYGHVGKEVDLDALSKLTAIGRTTISPNNPFLSHVGIISGGKKKQITEPGKRLARALDHNLEEQVSLTWREIIKGNEFLSNIVSTIRIKGGMTPEDAMGHVLFSSGASNTKQNRTGAKTVIDILEVSKLIEINNGKLQVASPPVPEAEVAETGLDQDKGQTPSFPSVSAEAAAEAGNPALKPQANGFGHPTVNINIQLQLPETDKPEVYEELFKALRKHLFPG